MGRSLISETRHPSQRSENTRSGCGGFDDKLLTVLHPAFLLILGTFITALLDEINNTVSAAVPTASVTYFC